MDEVGATESEIGKGWRAVTLNPKPWTIHQKPFTNQKPYTKNCKPKTP